MWTIISQFFEVLDSIGIEGEVDDEEVVYCTRVVELVIDLLVCIKKYLGIGYIIMSCSALTRVLPHCQAPELILTITNSRQSWLRADTSQLSLTRPISW